ncbi:bifunctional [glutamine synthetase] adenylyltransferase/[glutamine synthetase]-adenylyl-L-tyrosine phosphorylase [Sphingomonas sp. SM33]|uniref:Bifunctional [glutamine synthetase] adenylyltransferase/[glutamine synthetase]-adenylyl-L-tyrosine phosphorylase n=1 Tax=Sphingomonas telluris TaxID=2907998 RepID=A0ABS9VMM8_9SPHN|nr:bifunctional [glutamine synthetase] adenylyltransferase/[glutamine synthetase]-adenylyl-L-tyrosine phosphorylase [Sphingomonas telluris]MCH8616225.1 bifunctional [glutamine synthetase] adenylyltransferase/[glutamine synthetase]-adenylyl-L-tyrosine phosphorylase [Sphingomonas telluris]
MPPWIDAPCPWSVDNYRLAGRFPLKSAIGQETAATSRPAAGATRQAALDRAREFSPFLREAAAALPQLADLFVEQGSVSAIEAAVAVRGDTVEAELRRQRLGLALTVAFGDLAGELSFEEATGALSDFADSAIERALAAALNERVPGCEVKGITALALGKLGSRELNYSSDVDLLLLFDPETMPRRERDDPSEAAVRVGKRMIELLQKRTGDGYVVRVDLRLRPSPEVTPIVLPVNAAISHYESSALPWERAAFIRARVCAGDRTLGEHFLQSIKPFVWRRSLDFGVIEEVREISARIRDHYAQGAQLGPGFDLKRGRGGIREVEFFAQIQQMIHGGRDPAVREPATLDALDALQRTGKIGADDAAALAEAYRLFRTIEHRVQMIDDAQTHLLPLDRSALDQVAHLHELPDGDALIELLRPHVERTETLFNSLAPDREGRLSNDEDKLAEELRTLGFDNPDVAMRRIHDWRSGKARSLRSPAALTAFEGMLPGLLREIATGPDPERALNRFADIIERLSSGINLYRLLEARPQLARHLALILAHAPPLGDMLAARPDLLDGLIDESSFSLPPEPDVLSERLLSAMAGEAYDRALDRTRRQVNERRFALGVTLIAAHADPLDVAIGYSDVAESAVVALAELATDELARTYGRVPGAELIILALGRFGGRALTHASDLDIIYLYDAPPGAMSDGAKSVSATDYFNRLANRVTAALSVSTAVGGLYDVDTRLRPQGSEGMLAVSLEGFVDYQRGEAWTWEHMALCRARPIYGSAQKREKIRQAIHSILADRGDKAKIRADAAKMRDEMARHKRPSGPLDIKLGPGGLVDLEFAVHTLQLTNGQGLDTRLECAIAGLAEKGLMDPSYDADLRLLSRMLVVMRLVAPDGKEPPEKSRGLVASLCGHESWESLLAAHDEARQRIAALWKKVKEAP